jgi:microcystin degradation protein MlrC
MNLKFRELEAMPEEISRRGPRESRCLQAYVAAKNAKSGIIEVSPETDAPEDKKAVDKFYRSMVQWKNRHKETPVVVKRNLDRIVIQVHKEGTEGPPTQRTRRAKSPAATT